MRRVIAFKIGPITLQLFPNSSLNSSLKHNWDEINLQLDVNNTDAIFIKHQNNEIAFR